MNIFFDNCTAPRCATVLDAYYAVEGDRAYHIRYMASFGLSGSSRDVDWISALAPEANNWVVVTGDHRIRKNKLERVAWRQAGLRGFVFSPAYQKTPLNEVCSILLWRWPKMKDFISQTAKGSMFELSVSSKSAKFTSLAI